MARHSFLQEETTRILFGSSSSVVLLKVDGSSIYIFKACFVDICEWGNKRWRGDLQTEIFEINREWKSVRVLSS